MPSYMTVEDADLYFANRLYVRTWECSSAEEKRKGLYSATEIIDRLNFSGVKAVSTQTNQFPRDTDTVVPDDVQKAAAEIALALLDGVDPDMEYENLALKSQGYGGVKSTYSEDASQPHKVAGIPSVMAWRYLRPYLRDPNGLQLFRVN